MKNQHIPPYFLVFDVESLGLHGEGFAVAGGVYTSDGTEHDTFAFHCQLDEAEASDMLRLDEDTRWVEQNVTTHPDSEEMDTTGEVRESFWLYWRKVQNDYPGIVMAAECLWPVEARFLIDCVRDSAVSRNWEGPYPIHEIATFMLAAGMDPMGTYERLPHELPAHEPLADARLSARLLSEALAKIVDPT